MPELNKATNATFTATDTDLIDVNSVPAVTSNVAHAVGRLQNRTDKTSIEVSDGTSWLRALQYDGSPQTYTPTLTQSGTVTATVNRAEYAEEGIYVAVWFVLTVTGTGTSGNNITITLPINSAVTSSYEVGSGTVWRPATPFRYKCCLDIVSATTFVFITDGNNASPVGTTPAFGLVSGDVLAGYLRYRR